jgi:hypothetical protein
MDEMQQLAHTPSMTNTSRFMDCLLADEGPTSDGRPGVRPQYIHLSRERIPLTFLNTLLPVGMIEDARVIAPGCVPDSQGFALLATICVSETALAELCWLALQEGLFGGLCMSLLEWRDPAGLFTSGELQHVILGDRESSHLVNARVLRLR